MKRSPSSPPPSLESESREDTPCSPPPSTPRPKKAKKATTASPYTPDIKTSADSNATWKSTPGWTPDKKRALEIKIIETGIAGLDKAKVADEVKLFDPETDRPCH